MNVKLFCPHCGRCLGECNTSHDSASCRVLVNPPKYKGKKHFVHNMKCVKCKNEVFILMEFEN